MGAIRQLPIRVNLRGGPISLSVAATVHEAKCCALIQHCMEETGVPDLSTQSPSERCDGDCALRPGEPIASRLRLG